MTYQRTIFTAPPVDPPEPPMNIANSRTYCAGALHALKSMLA